MRELDPSYLVERRLVPSGEHALQGDGPLLANQVELRFLLHGIEVGEWLEKGQNLFDQPPFTQLCMQKPYIDLLYRKNAEYWIAPHMPVGFGLLTYAAAFYLNGRRQEAFQLVANGPLQLRAHYPVPVVEQLATDLATYPVMDEYLETNLLIGEGKHKNFYSSGMPASSVLYPTYARRLYEWQENPYLNQSLDHELTDLESEPSLSRTDRILNLPIRR